MHDGSLDWVFDLRTSWLAFVGSPEGNSHKLPLSVFEEDRLPMGIHHDNVSVAVSVEVAGSFSFSSGVHYVEQESETLVRSVVVLEQFYFPVFVEYGDILLSVVVIVERRIGFDNPASSGCDSFPESAVIVLAGKKLRKSGYRVSERDLRVGC